VAIDGLGCEPAALPSAAECTALGQAQALTLMDALNELKQTAHSTLEVSLAARLAALPSDEFLAIAQGLE